MCASTNEKRRQTPSIDSTTFEPKAHSQACARKWTTLLVRMTHLVPCDEEGSERGSEHLSASVPSVVVDGRARCAEGVLLLAVAHEGGERCEARVDGARTALLLVDRRVERAPLGAN